MPSEIPASEFLKFLRRLHGEFPGKVPLHLTMESYATHKHPKLREWLATPSPFQGPFRTNQFQLAESGGGTVRPLGQ
jgi:hypothetical protein